MTATIVDQQLVVHLYALTEGPDADRAFGTMRELWAASGQLFSMFDAIAGTDLPRLLPRAHEQLPDFATALTEVAVAAQERRGGDIQAIVRRHHDALNFSIALATRGGILSRWDDLDRQWTAVIAPRSAGLLGEVRIYCATLIGPAHTPLDGTAKLAEEFSTHLPGGLEDPSWRDRGFLLESGVMAWEISPGDEQQAVRRLVLIADEAHELSLSRLAWSDGGTAMPSLARYLLQIARLRYQVRVWRRDQDARELCQEVDRLIDRVSEFAWPAALRDLSDPDMRDSLVSGLHHLHAIGLDSLATEAGLERMRLAVDNVLINTKQLAMASAAQAELGFVARDLAMAEWFRDQLSADLHSFQITHNRLRRSAKSLASVSTTSHQENRAMTTSNEAASDVARNVFVVHGRDRRLSEEMFAFLRELDLRPMDWEEAVNHSGSASPLLGRVAATGISIAQATVVLLSPEDIVCLHPDLLDGDEHSSDGQTVMQARPNVLIELGMALALYPDRTVIVQVGDTRRIADIDGLNYVQLTAASASLQKIAGRLELAGCKVRRTGTGWLNPQRFSGLAAYSRRPPAN